MCIFSTRKKNVPHAFWQKKAYLPQNQKETKTNASTAVCSHNNHYVNQKQYLRRNLIMSHLAEVLFIRETPVSK